MFFETTTLGGRQNSKEFLKNLESTWSGFFFNEKSMKLQWGNRLFGRKWPKYGRPKMAKIDQKWPKNDHKSVKTPRKALKMPPRCRIIPLCGQGMHGKLFLSVGAPQQQ